MGKIFFFFFLIVFALGRSPTPHPISSRPHFVCKFSRRGSSSPVTSYLTPSITVLVLWIPIYNYLYQKFIYVSIYKLKTIEQPTHSYSL
jgi:hypothetical protein